MPTKPEVLAELSLLPLDTLIRIQKYAEYSAIPEEDLLVNVTMSQMVEKALALADQHFPEWTDRSSSDFGKFIIELVGLFSEKDFYYINAFASESFLSKMNVYSDAFIKSIELGYSPVLCKASEITFDVTFGASVSAFTYPRGGLSIALTGTSYKFTNKDPFTVPISGINVTVPLTLHEGEYLSDTQIFNGFRCDIRRSKIDVSSVIVEVDGVVWDRVNNFGQSGATSKHYMVLPEANGTASIYFGEDNFGYRPAVGSSIKATFLKGSGSEANGLSGAGTVSKQSTGRPTVSVINTSASANGTNPEDLDSIKNNAINFFSSKFTANNVTEAERWLLLQPEVKLAKVICQGANVYYRVHPVESPTPVWPIIQTSPLVLDTDLSTRITPYVNGGYLATALPTTYVAITSLAIEVYFLQGFNQQNILDLVKSFIADYTDPLVLGSYGKDFIKTDIEFLCKSRIEGLQNLVFTDINGGTADITVLPYELLEKIDTNIITLTPFVV